MGGSEGREGRGTGEGDGVREQRGCFTCLGFRNAAERS